MKSTPRQNLIYLLLFLFSVLSAPSCFARDDGATAFVEVELLPKGAVEGQKRILQVDVFVKKWFVKTPRLPDIKIENAIVLAPKSFGVNSTEVRHGIRYTKQRQEYLVFPAKQGAYRVEPFEIDLTLAPESLARGSEPIEMSVTTPGLIFLVKPQPIPALPSGSRLPLVSNDVSFTEAYINESLDDGDDKFVFVGDVLERRIAMQATETVVMSLPSFSGRDIKHIGLEEFDDYKVLRQISAVSDSLNRGSLVAERIETWQYVFSRAGDYQLPEIQLSYWHPEQQAFVELALPARNVRVRLNPLDDSMKDSAISHQNSGEFWRIAFYIGLVGSAFICALITFFYLLPKLKEVSVLKQFAQYCEASPSFFGQWARYFTWLKRELKSWRLLTHSLDCDDAEFIIHTYYRWLASYEARNVALVSAELSQPNLQRCLSELYGRNGDAQSLIFESIVLREDLASLRRALKYGVSKPTLFKLQSTIRTLPALNK